MQASELLLRHQQLSERRRGLEAEQVRLRARLESDPEVERLNRELAAAKERLQAISLRVLEMEREVETNRSRLRAHDRELMSGRIRSPADLTRMSAEVEHMKAHISEQEDAELELLVEQEQEQAVVAALASELGRAQAAAGGQVVELNDRVAKVGAELERMDAELESIWERVPIDYQAAYLRLSRLSNPVAEAWSGQCSACRVGLTAAELQQVRRGDHLVTCQSCNRILVAV